ncbi:MULTISPECIES: GntR family transcriptional regulator [unclassified Meridianimarinicoccus]|uniref:GntR family transcriptional regulator n=1 Tax=unclassified Meridianimarinicoccus TaxID=2923344 RepID=UPI0018688C54|nr:GntR family transcriptional regulator [Fluviibacterium sp. MJW13]
MADRAALPKYLQIAEFLVREITAGRLRVGDRLPPERQMADGMGIAVGTLRKALARLERQGILERRQGSGNYILDTDQGGSIYAFFRLERLDGGGLPRARVLSVTRLPKPADLPDFGGSDTAHRIRRLRYLDDRAVAAEEIWLDGEITDRLDAQALSESLYLYYRETLGLWITAIEDRIGVDAMPGWGQDTGCDEGAVCGHVLRQSRTSDGALPEVSRTWFNHDRARYVARNS